VSSAYLLIAEQMGLVGLGAFLVLVATGLAWAVRQRRAVYAAGERRWPGLPAQWLGLLAGLLAALAVGVVDHYFFRLSFQAAGTLFWLYVGLLLAATRLAVEGDGSPA